MKNQPPEETTAPWTRDSRIKTTLGTLISILVAVSAAAAAWTITRNDLQTQARTIQHHEQRLQSVETKAAVDHDILVEIRSDLKALMRERKP
jgi:hypothetical protein